MSNTENSKSYIQNVIKRDGSIQSERQKYIDQGQSLNLMIDPSTPAKEVNALYLHAWKRGIKTFYYQHSMNAAQQFGRKKLKEVNLKQKEVDQDEPKNVCVSCEA